MKKAKLDIWEDIPEFDIEKPGAQVPLEQASITEDESGGRWAFNKLLLIGAPVVLVVLIICGFLTFYLLRDIDPQKQTTISQAGQDMVRQVPVRTTLPEASGKEQRAGTQSLSLPETTIIYFKDFVIDLKDARGMNYVLMFDIAFDLGKEQKRDQLENTTALRNIIYKTAQTRSVVALKSVEERKKLKKDLAFALEKILGDGCVKNVYFMNYFIM